jgi:hypothetical protein
MLTTRQSTVPSSPRGSHVAEHRTLEQSRFVTIITECTRQENLWSRHKSEVFLETYDLGL